MHTCYLLCKSRLHAWRDAFTLKFLGGDVDLKFEGFTGDLLAHLLLAAYQSLACLQGCFHTEDVKFEDSTCMLATGCVPVTCEPAGMLSHRSPLEI